MTEPSVEVSLARLSVQMETLQRQIGSVETRLGQEFVTSRDLSHIDNNVTTLRTTVEDSHRSLAGTLRDMRKDFEADLNGYITKEEFDPIKRLVYGMVAVLLSGVVGALLLSIFKDKVGA